VNRSTHPINPAKISAMKRACLIVGLIQTFILVGFAVGLAGKWFPLGVRGEWEWLRLRDLTPINPVSLGLAAVVVAGYAGFVALGARSLVRVDSIAREAAWVVALAIGAVFVQGITQEGAPEGLGLAKWIIALQSSGSSGYHTVARREMPGGLGPFLRDYPAWIERQDSLHIGTHPPGLFVVARVLDDLTRDHPELSRRIIALAPGSVGAAIRLYRGSGALGRDEAAALTLTGALTLLGSALTVIPLYLLARAEGSAVVAWAAATLWPLMPAAIMFQPTADTAFPFLSVSSMAAAVWAVRSSRMGTQAMLAVAAGLILAMGMGFTLAFLAVGLVVAIPLLTAPRPFGWKTRIGLIVLTGFGFAVATAAWWIATSANPLAIWWTNQNHHAQFYRDYPRSRLAWAGVNLVESTVAVGLASTVWAAGGLARFRTVPRSTWATLAVLVLLTASGRSLSEVARLWLPMYPPILLGSAVAWNRLGASPLSLGWTVGLVGVQTLFLQTMIQVVYPI